MAAFGLPFLAATLAGCAGAGYGDFNRGLGGDINSGYNSSIAGRQNDRNTGATSGIGRGTYPMLSTSFQLSSLPGDPFDYEKVNVQVTLRKPDNSTVDIPAFYDGENTWRMRFTPTSAGTYAVASVKLNGQIAHEEKLEKKDWSVAGDTQPGFVRLDRGDHARFVFDNGARYYPLGHNQAWHSDKLPDTPALFAKMHDAGENWSRVWMTHWDGKNLDWPSDAPDAKADKLDKADKTAKPGKAVKLGDIDLAAVKKWDAIVEGAQKNGIYFQMVLQHYGQYSTKVDPNWNANPYNVKNGGFLQNPEEFFSNPQARALTKRKLYYILARWGYSPNILAFELFNEVEGTDAGRGKMTDQIALWHREMTLFLRQYDGYRHLLTTSSAPAIAYDSPVWETVDYVQTHTYPSDILTALGATETPDTYGATKTIKSKKPSKPEFIGEFGPSGLTDAEGVGLHQGLWSSLMRNGTGAAQYWDWNTVEQNNLYSHFKAASGFVTASGLASHGSLVNTTLPIETTQTAALRFGPGGGFVKAAQNEFVVGKEGAPQGMDQFPTFLQGEAHRDMMPKPLTLHVQYPQPGTFAVNVEKTSKAGAHLKVSVDGKSVERDFAAADADRAPKVDERILKVDVPQGAHAITIENTGKDWLVVRQFALSNYASALACSARVGKDFAVAWVYHRGNIYESPAKDAKATAQETATGKILVTGLQPGKYRYTWWDTYAGKALTAEDVSVDKAKDGLQLPTPPIITDAALYITKAAAAAPIKTAKK